MKQTVRAFVRLTIAAILCLATTLEAVALPAKPSKRQANTSNTLATPDFAYPEQVIKDADKSLKSDLAKKNYPGVVSALLNKGQAMLLINADSINACVNLIDKTAAKVTDPSAKAVIRLLQADFICNYYKTDRWNFDQRLVPADELGSDMRQWSGAQMRDTVISLINSAMAASNQLLNTPLTTYKDIIKIDDLDLQRVYFPSMLDFAVYQSIEMLESFSDPIARPLPEGLLLKEASPAVLTMLRVSKTRQLQLQLLDMLIKQSQSRPGPRVHATVERLNVATEEDEQLMTNPLNRLYQSSKATEFSGDYLIALYFYDDNPRDDLVDYYNAICHHLDQFPTYPRRDVLQDIKHELERKVIYTMIRSSVSPAKPFTITICSRNIKSGTIDFYETSTPFAYPITTTTTGKPTYSVPFTVEAPSVALKETPVECSIPKTGCYLVKLKSDGLEASNKHSCLFVSELGLYSFTDNLIHLKSIDPVTGKAVAGATIFSETGETVGRTDSKGYFMPPVLGRSIQYYGKKEDSLSDLVFGSRPAQQYQQKATLRVGITTSLAVYHPGDTIEWAGCVYRVSATSQNVEPDCRVRVEVTDVNRRTVMTDTLVADNWGRVNGRCPIPGETLTGYYLIVVTPIIDTPESLTTYSEHHQVMVSDYKLPTFLVDSMKVERDTPQTGAVTISGRAVTYSGFPLIDAKVELSVSKSTLWWRYFGNPDIIATLETVTDANGDFQAVVPAELLNLFEPRYSFFHADASVTSQSGETQSGSTSFSLGRKYAILAQSQIAANALRPVSVNVKVVDATNEEISSLIDWQLVKDNRVVLSEQANTPVLNLDLSKVESGKYELRFNLPDTTLAAQVATELTLYRPTDIQSPVDETIWLPQLTIQSPQGSTAQIGFEAQHEGLHLTVVSVVNNYSSTISEIVTKAGYNTIDVAVPDTARSVNVQIVGIIDHQSIYQNITVDPIVTKPAIRIVKESFRDRLVPGAPERWHFKVVNNDDTGVEAALIMDMFNSALNKIEPYRPMRFQTLSPTGPIHLSAHFGNDILYLLATSKSPKFVSSTLTAPLFLKPYQERLYTRLMKSAPTMASRNTVMYETVIVEDMAAGGAVAEADVTMSDTDGGTMNMDLESATESLNGSEPLQQLPQQQPFVYRDNEVALAMFRPLLTTDADGNIDISFTVPNANTTWSLKCLAFTRDLLSTTLNTEIIAAKEIMVQPNLPRFVRAGDTVEIRSTVMNNSANDGDVTTVVELFDPTTGAVTHSYRYVNMIAAGGSTTLTTSIEAPADKAMLGFRVKSSAENSADGEQTLIPILPSSQPVIESTTFYMSPEQNSQTIEIPASGAGDRVMLTFCENPAWSVVTALPGLIADEQKTALGASYAIFSAAVAQGLMRDNPVIAKQLRSWLASNRSDSTLVSMLERNQDLKRFMLNMTPWVQAAQSDTERMTRLALLFDSKAIESTINSNIAIMKKLTADGGGFRWASCADKPSLWITTGILINLGRLDQLGYMPDNRQLKSMLKEAVLYVDRETAARFKKYPGADYSEFAFMRRYYKDIKMSTAAAAVNAAAVQSAITGWKTASLYNKAYLGHILLSNGYRSTVSRILESLRQYSEYTPAKGMWWPSMSENYNKLSCSSLILTLFASVDPDGTEVDRIRQWLIGEKELQDWGSAASTTDVIAAILSSSKAFFNRAGNVTIAIDGERLELPRFDSAVGRFNINLTERAPQGGSMVIARGSDSPSWGSVMTFAKPEMTGIKAVSTEGLSIQKKLYLVTSNADGSKTVTETTEFNVGDLVRVELIIDVDRTLDYVSIDDQRPACLEPVDQLPAPVYQDGAWFYRENRDAVTNIFVSSLRRGVYRLSYEMRVNNAGKFAGGVASIQSQYAPGMTAHSAGAIITVK